MKRRCAPAAGISIPKPFPFHSVAWATRRESALDTLCPICAICVSVRSARQSPSHVADSNPSARTAWTVSSATGTETQISQIEQIEQRAFPVGDGGVAPRAFESGNGRSDALASRGRSIKNPAPATVPAGCFLRRSALARSALVRVLRQCCWSFATAPANGVRAEGASRDSDRPTTLGTTILF